jgi:hypothetical protein
MSADDQIDRPEEPNEEEDVVAHSFVAEESGEDYPGRKRKIADEFGDDDLSRKRK